MNSIQTINCIIYTQEKFSQGGVQLQGVTRWTWLKHRLDQTYRPEVRQETDRKWNRKSTGNDLKSLILLSKRILANNYGKCSLYTKQEAYL